MPERDPLDEAHEAGAAAARRGEEAAPGCTATTEGRAWLKGYVEGAKVRSGAVEDRHGEDRGRDGA